MLKKTITSDVKRSDVKISPGFFIWSHLSDDLLWDNMIDFPDVRPRKLTCHLKRDHWKRNIAFQPAFFMGYVSYRGRTCFFRFLEKSSQLYILEKEEISRFPARGFTGRYTRTIYHLVVLRSYTNNTVETFFHLKCWLTKLATFGPFWQSNSSISAT